MWECVSVCVCVCVCGMGAYAKPYSNRRSKSVFIRSVLITSAGPVCLTQSPIYNSPFVYLLFSPSFPQLYFCPFFTLTLHLLAVFPCLVLLKAHALHLWFDFQYLWIRSHDGKNKKHFLNHKFPIKCPLSVVKNNVQVGCDWRLVHSKGWEYLRW